MSTPFKIKIVNDRTDNLDQLYIMLTVKNQTGLTGISAGVPVKFTQFQQDNPEMTISATTVEAARLYVGYGKFPDAPVPEGDQYYGWIEFTKLASDNGVWINLSNVDLTALPLVLASKTLAGEAWTLGYKEPIETIIASLEKTLTGTDAAKITCATGQTKILGPNKVPDAFASYDSYRDSLANASAPLVVVSDTPAGGTEKWFTGSFLPASSDTDPIIKMTDEDGKEFIIQKGQLTTEILYACDGGTLIYDGKTVKQNRTAKNDPDSTAAERVITNSTFRNICIGINEGYFKADSDNYSANFPILSPFADGHGSAYAKVLHESSNSYGFPYADSNLKVLIEASPSEDIVMTICTDKEKKNYDNDPPQSKSNFPIYGKYEFGIGAHSSELGIVEIGNGKAYPKTEDAYGEYLPTMTEWTKMYFSGPDKYIWFKTVGDGEVSATDCFKDSTNPNGAPLTPTWITNKATGHHVLTWGANIIWNTEKDSPPEPE